MDMLNMRDFAERMVGVSGEGLYVEQRKVHSLASNCFIYTEADVYNSF